MRILTHLLSLERLGGIEVSTLEATRALTARGHEVHVIHGAERSGGRSPDMRDDLLAAGAVLHGPFPFSTPTIREGVPAIASYLPAAAAAARLRPDVLWLQRTEHIVWGQTLARRAGVPIVGHLHHSPNYGRGHFGRLAFGVRFLSVSEFIRRQWIDVGLRPDRVATLLNAVPTESYPPADPMGRIRARDALGVPTGPPVVLYYGRLTEDKGIDTLIDAWTAWAPHGDDAHLVVAGNWDSGTGADLRRRFEKLTELGTVTHLAARPDVIPLLHAADLVVVPSSYDEPCSRVLLESLMSELPVIGSHVGGTPEVLTGPLSRLLVPRNDPPALAAALSGLAHWRRDEPDLGRTCRAHALTRHSFDGYIDTIEQTLTEAVERRRARWSVHRGNGRRAPAGHPPVAGVL